LRWAEHGNHKKGVQHFGNKTSREGPIGTRGLGSDDKVKMNLE